MPIQVGVTSFPDSVWDGETRTQFIGTENTPSTVDWTRVVNELIATQQYILNNIGGGSGTITDGAVTTAKLANRSVTSIKIALNAIIPELIADGAITTPAIANENVTTAKLADGAVDNSKLGLLSVATGNLQNAAVTTAKIADLNITTTKIAFEAVTTNELGDLAVTEDKLANLSVSTGKLQDDSVTTAKIGDNQVITAKILNSAVTNGKLATDSVTTVKIVDFNVTTAKLADGSVTTIKLADLAVTNAKLSLLSVGTGNIIDSAVTTAKINDGAVDNSKLALLSVATGNIIDSAVTTIKIADLNITTGKLADLSVTTAKIADNNVTTAKIADSNVTTAKLADGSVTTVKITDLNVTTGKLADSAVTGLKVATNTLTYDKFQQESANTILGNPTGSTANVQEIICTAAGRALLDDAAASDQRTTLGLGTSAVKDIPSSGDATTGQVVYGTDTRLTDSRTPTLHHTTHESGGSDAIKLDDLSVPDDNTDLNASITAHGLLKKLANDASQYMGGDGNWSTPVGTRWKREVRVSDTANANISIAFANGQTLDGVTLATGDRILIQFQSITKNNGIYIVQASGAPVRATDADSASEMTFCNIVVQSGTLYANTAYTIYLNGTVLDTDPVVVSALDAYTGGGLIGVSAGRVISLNNLSDQQLIGRSGVGPGVPTAITVHRALVLNSGNMDVQLTAGTGIAVTHGTTTETVAVADTAVTLGSYGSATQVGTFTVDQQGRLTAASNTTITGVVPSAHASTHMSAGSDPIRLDELKATTDVTTLNASTSAHGLLKKLSGTATEYMGGDGNWSTPLTQVLNQTGVTDRIGDSSIVEETLYSYSIAAGTIGANNSFILRVMGEYFNNSGAIRNITIKIKLGTTTLWADTLSIGNSAVVRSFALDAQFQNQNSTSAQKMTGHIRIGDTGTPASGLGTLLTTFGGIEATIGGSSSEAMAGGAKIVSVTIQMGASNSSLYVDLTGGEVLKH